ncbi:MAG TPA: PqqD family protein [Terriglobales bacterium]|nr:PqqD family protein [Terriglobales bacterium]
MPQRIDLDAAYGPSEDVVVREVEGELIIVPLVAGVGDLEDELYTLNETGRAVWRRLDGRRTVRSVVAELADEFEAPAEAIEADVLGLLAELERRRIVARKA